MGYHETHHGARLDEMVGLHKKNLEVGLAIYLAVTGKEYIFKEDIEPDAVPIEDKKDEILLAMPQPRPPEHYISLGKVEKDQYGKTHHDYEVACFNFYYKMKKGGKHPLGADWSSMSYLQGVRVLLGLPEKGPSPQFLREVWGDCGGLKKYLRESGLIARGSSNANNVFI
jgi:hypothetical protein